VDGDLARRKEISTRSRHERKIEGMKVSSTELRRFVFAELQLVEDANSETGPSHLDELGTLKFEISRIRLFGEDVGR